MIKQLRFDFYKLIHSRVMWGVWIAELILVMVNPVSQVITSHDSAFLTLEAASSDTFVLLGVVIFVGFFVGADYRSGYIKTIVTRVNWAYYVLSKVIYTFAFCILFGFAYQLFVILFTLMGGGKVYEPNEAHLGGALYYKLLCEVFMAFAYGMLVMFVLMATKSTVAALIVGFVYYFIFGYVYDLADIILVACGAKKLEFGNIIAHYTVMGLQQWFFQHLYDYSSGKILQDNMGRYSAITLLYSLAAIGFSILIGFKRKRKN